MQREIDLTFTSFQGKNYHAEKEVPFFFACRGEKMVDHADVNEKVTNLRKKNDLDAKVSKCYICNLPVKKYKLIKHRRNCQILQKQKQRIKQKECQDISLSSAREVKKEKFYCDLCPKYYDYSSNLSKHKKKYHT